MTKVAHAINENFAQIEYGDMVRFSYDEPFNATDTGSVTSVTDETVMVTFLNSITILSNIGGMLKIFTIFSVIFGSCFYRQFYRKLVKSIQDRKDLATSE